MEEFVVADYDQEDSEEHKKFLSKIAAQYEEKLGKKKKKKKKKQDKHVNADTIVAEQKSETAGGKKGEVTVAHNETIEKKVVKKNKKRKKSQDKVQDSDGKKKKKKIRKINMDDAEEDDSGSDGSGIGDDNEEVPKVSRHKKRTYYGDEGTAKLQKKLIGARFRMLNENLYSIESSAAVTMFEEHPELFSIYHQGFSDQVSKWPDNPVQDCIKWLKKRPSLVVADFGCGEAEIAASVQNKVHSFDLVAANDSVVACDMANTPLDDKSIDVAIFCLSLMGTNWEDFIREAYRVMKPKGILKIAEVASRIENTKDFIRAIKKLGFAFNSKDESNTHFVKFDFTKDSNTKPISGSTGVSLGICKYKKR